ATPWPSSWTRRTEPAPFRRARAGSGGKLLPCFPACTLGVLKKLALLGIAVTFGLLAVTPAATAFHGSPYTAHGIATRNNQVYTALVDWTGWAPVSGQEYNSYYVTLTDPATGVNVVNTHFPGYEQWIYGGPLPSQWELFIYNGLDVPTNGQTFHIAGFQQIQQLYVEPKIQTMLYEGNYQDYTLLLAVDGFSR
ncbi:MAG: hypothetical protein LC624_05840, partial [Halobacteriales archaeon]|nr:hypothetical protein [Halobacteriales archaeon]